jgi:hypothetical protein
MRLLPGSLYARVALAVLLSVIVAAVIFGLRSVLVHDDHMARPMVHKVHAAKATPRRQTSAVAVITPKPSEYDREQQMSFGQLMNRWNSLVLQASRKFNVPAPWIRAVMAAESGGRTMSAENRPLTSSAGALGLMQLMPQTYNDMRVQYGLGTDPLDPHDNIFAGAALLHQLYVKYGFPVMFTAYNDGPGNLEQRLTDGRLLPEETRAYTADITRALSLGVGLHGVRAKFTRPNGEAVWIDTAAIVSVRAALPGEYAPRVLTVITVGRIKQGVCENVGRVRAILRGGRSG